MRHSSPLIAIAVILGACASRADEAPAADAASAAPAVSASSAIIETANATLRDSAGRELGTLSLTNAPTGIRIAGSLHGLPPGEHGFHVHTTGTCEAPFTSAGGHWNPTSRQHGSENPAGPHHGDLTNITVGADGAVVFDVTTAGGSLLGVDALLDADGAAIIVHAASDDYRTDPTGNAGSRFACGEIRRP